MEWCIASANVLILVFNTDAIHWTGTVLNTIKEDNMDPFVLSIWIRISG